mgnify:CR=1 FL=1
MKDKTQPRPEGRQVKLSTLLLSVALVAVVSFVVGTRSDSLRLALSPILGKQSASEQLDLSSVRETYQVLAKNYDGKLDTQKLIDGASRGLVKAAGDDYTVFMSAEEAEEFNDALEGTISGIGAEIGVRNNQPTILRVLENSPAAREGLQPQDEIIAVDGESTAGFNASETAELIRGEAGTTVKLELLRAGDKHSVRITRAEVSDPSVSSEIKNGVGILTIRRFDDQTADLARRAAEKFKAKDVNGVVLDLRDNGGGYLDQARRVAGIWLNDKLVVSERRDGKVTDKLDSIGQSILNGVDTVVLVNGGSASASEIVAGALRDHNAAKLIGEQTFGKGTVQQVIDLSGGGQLKVTVARWFTPGGVNLSQHGLKPDKKVELKLEDMNAGRDPQLNAAISSL